MAKKNEDLENDLEELELEGEEADEEEESEASSEGSDAEKKDKKEEKSEDDEESEDEEESDSEEKSEADREAIRERRRRERKMRKERERREKAAMFNKISALEQENKQFKERLSGYDAKFGSVEEANAAAEMSNLASIYNKAQAVMEKAVAEGDGKSFTEAKAISDKAWARYTLLQSQKTIKREPEKREEPVKQAKEEIVKEGYEDLLDDEGKKYGVAWLRKNSSWYDPAKPNRETKLMQALDEDLYNEGYDPNTPEYWEELTDRGREILPHRFKATDPAKKKPKQVVGSGGGAGPVKKESTLPKEFVQTLKAAGYWEDPKKRDAAIKDYRAQQKKGA